MEAIRSLSIFITKILRCVAFPYDFSSVSFTQATVHTLSQRSNYSIAATHCAHKLVTAFNTFRRSTSHILLCLGPKQSDFMCAWDILLCCCLQLAFFFLSWMFLCLVFFSKENEIGCCCFFDFLTALSDAIYFTLYSLVFLRNFFLFSYHLWIYSCSFFSSFSAWRWVCNFKGRKYIEKKACVYVRKTLCVGFIIELRKSDFLFVHTVLVHHMNGWEG